jgi:hypothetical protein
MKKRGLLLGLLLIALLWIFWPSPFMGRWSGGGVIDESQGWTQTASYYFHYYSVDGYPPLHERGVYWVKEKNEDTYTLGIWIPGSGFRTQQLVLLNGQQATMDGVAMSR